MVSVTPAAPLCWIWLGLPGWGCMRSLASTLWGGGGQYPSRHAWFVLVYMGSLIIHGQLDLPAGITLPLPIDPIVGLPQCQYSSSILCSSAFFASVCSAYMLCTWYLS